MKRRALVVLALGISLLVMAGDLPTTGGADVGNHVRFVQDE